MPVGEGLRQAAADAVLPFARAAHSLTWQLSGTDWIFLGLALVAIQASSRLGMWVYCAVTLPGTLAHELAHFLVALPLGARPSLPSIIPQKAGGGWRMGSVTFSAGILRSVPIALAPLVLAPLSLWWAGAFLPMATMPWYVLHGWVAATMFAASLPSSEDWKIAAPTLLLAVAGLVAFQFA